MLVVSCFETECPIKSLLLRIRFVLRKSWIVCVHNLLRHLASDKMLQCNFIFSICGWEIKSSLVLMVSTFPWFFVIVWIARVQFLCVWLTNCYDLKCISGWITRNQIILSNFNSINEAVSVLPKKKLWLPKGSWTPLYEQNTERKNWFKGKIAHLCNNV